LKERWRATERKIGYFLEGEVVGNRRKDWLLFEGEVARKEV
jgi:hypothetical protein